MAKRFQILVEFPASQKVIKKLGTDKSGEVQKYVTEQVMANLPDFMPRESGQLIAGMTKKDDWHVHIAGPYARFLFFGKTAAGQPVDYSKQQNPNAGPNWDRRMVAERGAAIVAAANRKFRRRK